MKIFIDTLKYGSTDVKPMDCSPNLSNPIIIGQTYLTFGNKLIKIVDWAFHSRHTKIYLAEESNKKNSHGLMPVYDELGYFVGSLECKSKTMTSEGESRWDKRNINIEFGLKEKINLL